ncbi:heme ABC exporter ATP-binding protein CcmA [Marinomonas epiphytica]
MSFSLKSGQAAHVKGTNGAGKSSLLKAILGLIPMYSGRVVMSCDNPQYSGQDFRKQCLYLGHTSGVKRHLSVIENLRQFNPQSSGQALELALQELALSEHRDAFVHQLSQGQMHRVALCRLLLSEKAIWVLDEPFTSLDDIGRHLIERLMLKHMALNGMILFTSHIETTQLDAHQVVLA